MTRAFNVLIRAFKAGDEEPFAVRNANNVITNVGRNAIRNIILGHGENSDETQKFLPGPAPVTPTSIGMGVGNTTAQSKKNTALDDEVFRRKISRRSLYSPSSGVYTVKYQTRFLAGEGGAPLTIREIGLFNSPTLGEPTLFARCTFAGIEKGALDILWIAWDINIGP